MATHGIQQLIESPARITKNSKTMIDLISISRLYIVKDCSVLQPFCSDHCPVTIILKECMKSTRTYQKKVYDYNLINKDNICSHIENTDWQNVLSSAHINMNIDSFVKTLSHICNSHIPKKTVTIRRKATLWVSNNIRKLIRKRNRQHKVAKLRNRESDWTTFRVLRNQVTSAVRKVKRDHIAKLDTEINNKRSTKLWWRLVKNYMNKKSENTSI